MSIKIKGDGNKENVFSDSESGMPLWNDAPFGLLPPDLAKKQHVELSGPDNLSRNPFIVPSDGWIIDIGSDLANMCTIDGNIWGPSISTYGLLNNNNNTIVISISKSIPYPVKKGQVISCSEPNILQITFAPCMSV